MDIPASVFSFLSSNGFGDIQFAHPLTGGLISFTRRLKTINGSFILKQRACDFDNLYEAEADGLAELAKPSAPRTPKVLDIGAGHILLEDLGTRKPEPGFWAEFGRQVAHLHSNTSPKFGFRRNNYLGILEMDNSWTDDGHEFFARTRILRFLSEPLAEKNLTSQDRQRVESIARRLPDLIPYQPPSLLHGDLWISNMLVDQAGQPALIDPGVYYGWPEAELSMTAAYEGVDKVFFEAYREVHPLEPGWEERFVLLNIRELLSMIAHNGAEYGVIPKLRDLLDQFA